MNLPLAEDLQSLVIRTDFSDDATWATVRSAVAEPVAGFRANVEFLDDPRYEELSVDSLLELVPAGSEPYFVFLVDAESISKPEHPILVVDLAEERGRTFRTLPTAMWDVQANLLHRQRGLGGLSGWSRERYLPRDRSLAAPDRLLESDDLVRRERGLTQPRSPPFSPSLESSEPAT